ncbi:MAG: Tim44-like domain-containing protein [Burkholderiales bacterium]
MRSSIVSLFALAFFAGLLADDAEARGRLGGGRSLGTQRQLTAPQKQVTPPAQQQPAAAPQAPGSGRWFAPLAGLAAGLGLGWLFAHGGFGPVIGALLMALLAGAVVFALMRLLARQPLPGARAQYGTFGERTVTAPPPLQLPENPGARPNVRSVPELPAGFDAERFLEEARRNFLRLQEANDLGDLERLREVTTGELFDALEGDLGARGKGHTDVVRLDAALLELVTQGGLHWASVKFSGSIREEAGAPPEPFEEIWHLQKPVTGHSGWLLAGIQQPS